MPDVADTFAAYADGRDGARFTDWLRARSEPDWTAAVDGRFVRELGEDTMDADVFRRYLEQDYAFVETLTGTFGHALGEAPSMAAKGRLADFLGTLTSEENDYFERSFGALDGNPEADPDATTRAFIDLLERAGREGGYAETLAVLVPAEWVYETWATGIDDPRPERFYLDEWIELHANSAFVDFVGWLRAELDREGAAASPRRQRRLDRLFRRTVELERAFFAAAYD
ncbi:TenA family protein [Haloplanus aerogenes]|uniref:Thiaminase/transcriptional activator TenA n=1 Tax=Haloplanus aerogenes TaxID=660522 RepID=A0A3M0DQU1_9EURY|nr:TenA family protein [Haloplanus aerogenes]AZH24353.1 transcriptional regulator [Haloplanus aerogenes]RMB24012.1 thiaminase/transcriptional activator TenA [Haloplanus aerogenes]